MDTEKVARQLANRFPGKNIIRLPEDNPGEIVCEIQPTGEHPDHSVAIAVIDRSEPHRHENSTERYAVMRGKLLLKLASGREVVMHEGGIGYSIEPGTVHSAEGLDGEAWVRITSRPDWTVEDHILVEADQPDS